MIQNLHFQYPTWFLLLCLLLGLGYAMFLYFNERKFIEAPKWTRPLLAFLRTISVAAIAALLLSPFIKTIKEDTQEAIILVAQDNSSSVISEMSDSEVAQFIANSTAMTEKLGTKYETKRISFGEIVKEGSINTFTQQVTNLSSLIDYVNDNYADQNLGALIITTDGIYNEGKNPIYSKLNLTAPIYTVAMGDTTKRKDVLVKNVFHNKIAYLGDKFSIQADVQAINAAGASTKLKVQQMGTGGKVLKEEVLNIKGNDYFSTQDIILEANSTGNIKYRISVQGINNEMSKENNYKDIFIEVLDARQKILILANAPHPDLGAMKSLITTNKNYEVDIKYPEGNNYNINDYNVVVLHNLPSRKNKIVGDLKIIKRKNISILHILGSQTDANAFNRIQNVIKLEGNSNSLENIQAEVDQSFSLFTTSDDIKRKLGQFPPLIAPFGKYTTGATTQSLISQNISKIKTEYPLLAFSNSEGKRQAVLTGEGIWKWRIYDYLQHDTYLVTQELVNKTIQYLSLKDDKRKFRSSNTKNIYKENESVILDAQLYNENYESINDPEVNVTVTDNEGKEFNYIMNRTQDYYTLDAGRFAEGNYRYISRTNLAGKSYEDKGRFSVQSIQLENFDLTARHGVLKSLSEKYGGKMVYPNELDSLATEILASDALKPVIFQSSKTQSIMHLRWLFFLLTGMLVLEWFIRRYMGSY